MSVSRERIERAHQSMIEIIAARSDRKELVPIVHRLEQELAQKESTAATLERIMAMPTRN